MKRLRLVESPIITTVVYFLKTAEGSKDLIMVKAEKRGLRFQWGWAQRRAGDDGMGPDGVCGVSPLPFMKTDLKARSLLRGWSSKEVQMSVCS